MNETVTTESSERAKEIIAFRDREQSRQGPFRSLWQSTADMIFPQTYGIAATNSPGSELMVNLFDTTAVEEAENMASGITNNLFPPGQQFFALTTSNTQYAENRTVEEYLSYVTQEAHRCIANSNFQAQVGNTIHYWLTFGTAALYGDWTAKAGLNYRDYAIGTYQCLENSAGVIDTIILTCPMTARQIVQDYGPKAGPSILEAYAKPESRNDPFNVIQVVRPRQDFDPNPWLRPAARMPFESVFVQEKDAIVLDRPTGPEGFDEFPFAVPRYQVIYREVYGRGRGTAMLRNVRVLNRLAKDYLEMSNKWVNPPREVLESFEGTVNVTPGAENIVQAIPSIKAIDMGANGAYPVTKDILEYRRDGVRQGFFKNAFEALTNLTGDRRTTTEIIERLKEGMKRLNKPLGRLFTELLEPTIRRTVMLLIRNGVLEPPPIEKLDAEIEFINPLALALRDQQSRGLQYWVEAGMAMSEKFPGILDNVEADDAYRDLGRSLGVKTTHIRPLPNVEKVRQQRAQDQAKLEAAEMAAMAAEGYGKTTKAPEQGSLAGAMTGGD